MRLPTGKPVFARILRHPAALVVAVFALSCLGDSAGPNVARPGHLQLVPAFESSAPAGIVPIARIRVRLIRPSDASLALDTVVQVSPGDTMVNMNLMVAVFTRADTFTAHLDLVTPAGDTAFRGGPLTVIGTPTAGASSTRPPPVPVPLDYIGIGSEADSVVITVQPSSVFSSETVSFQAVAYDNDAPLPATPVGWFSLDQARATVPRVTVGDVVGGTQRGLARIVAQLVTGQADTGSVLVHLLPSTIEIVSGNNQSAGVGARLAQPLVARLKASDGLPVPDFPVDFTVLSGGGTLSAGSAQSDANGEASVLWALGPLPGTHTMRAISPRSPVAQATFSATAITIGAASFDVRGLVPTPVAGTAGDLVVTAKDAAGGTVTDYNGTIHFTSNDPLASLPPNYTFVPGDNGTHTFTGAVTLRTAGSRTVTVSDIAAPATSGSQAVDVQPGSVAFLSVAGIGNPVTAGTVSGITVTARDGFNNTVPAYRGTVHFTSNDTAATLPGDYTYSAGDNGSHVFSNAVTLRTSGVISVVATDLATQTLAGAQTVLVNPDVPHHLAFSVTPQNTLANGVFTPAIVVSARDVYENVATSFTGDISLAIGSNPAGGTLGGTTTVTATSGTATFSNLSINNNGVGYTLVASGGGLPAITSPTFDILLLGANVTWVNQSGGNWSVGANWSGGSPPGPTEVAEVTLDGTYTVTVDQDVNVAGLVVGGGSGTQTVAVNSRTLTLNGASTIGTRGNLSVDFGIISGSGTLTNNGTLSLYYGTMNGPISNGGLLLSRYYTNVAGNLTTLASSVIRVEGDYNCCTGYLYVANGFTNNGTIELTAINGTGSASYFEVTSGTLINAPGGVILSQAGTGGTRTINAALDNQGTVTVNQALQLDSYIGQLSNSGTINVNGADLVLYQGGATPTFTNTGVITIAAGRTLTINYGTLDQAAGSIGGEGTLSLNGVTANLATDFSNATTGLVLTSSTVNGPGTLTNAASHTLSLYYSTIAAPLVNEGLLLLRGSSYLTGAPGSFTTATSSVLRVEGDANCCAAYLYATNGFTNNGIIELTAINSAGTTAYMTVTNGTLVNASGASIVSAVGTGGARYLDAQLDNQGTVTVSQALTMGRSSSVHTNSGTIDLSGGDLTLNQNGATPSFTNSGTVTIPVGRTWTISGGTLNQAGTGTIGGAGTLSLNGMTANLATDFSNATTGLVLSSTTVNGPGTLTNAAGHTLSSYYSTIAAPLVNEGLLLVRGTSYLTGAPGTFTTTPTSVLRLEGDATCCAAYLYVTNGFTNNGTIELTAINSTGTTAYLTVTNGTLVNAPGATILAMAGAGGLRYLDAQLDNQGTVTVSQGFTMSRSSSAITNSGTIDIGGADFTLNQGGTTPSFTNTGTVTIAATRTWTVTNGTLNQAGTLGGTGTLTLNTVTANLTTAFSNDTLGLVLNSTTVNGPGTLTNVAGRTLALYYSTIAAPLANHGLLLTRGSSYLTGAPGTFTTAGTSLIRVEGDANCCAAYLYVTNGFTNNGTIELAAINASGTTAYMSVTNGTLVNASGASIVTVTGTGGARNLDAQLDNQVGGTLTTAQPLTMGRSGSAITNHGTMDLSAADLTVNQNGASPSFTNTGTITLGSGRTWTVNNGTVFLTSGTVGGAGSVVLNSVTLDLTTDFSNATTGFTLSSSTVTGTGTLTNVLGRTLTIYQTTVASTFVNQGTLVARGSSTISTAPGFFTMEPGSTLRLEGDASCCASSLTVTNGFTNHGTIDLTSVNANGTTASLTVTTGTLDNAPDGVILVSQGTGGARTLTVDLRNQAGGTVTVNLSDGPTPALQTLSMSRANSGHVNDGTITLNGGSVTLGQSGTPNSFTNNGTLTIGAGRTWTVNNGTFTQAGGLNGGGITMNSVTSANFAAPFALSALTLNNSTATFANDLTTAGLALVLNNATLNGPGTLTNPVGETLTLTNSTAIAASMPVNNQGTLVVHGSNSVGTLGNTGTLRVEGSAASTGTLTVGSSFTNNGAIELTNNLAGQAAILNVTGTLTNASGATISALAGLGGGTRTLGVTLDNQGTVTLDHALTLNRAAAAHLNSGTLNLAAGDLTLSGAASFTNTGTITVPAGRLWTINNGTFSQQAGSLTGGGAMTMNSVTNASFGTAFSLSALTLNNTTASFTSNLTTTGLSLTLNNATLSGPGTLTNAAGETLTLTNSTDIGATMPVANLGTLVVRGSNSINTLTTTAASVLRVEGSSASTGTLTVGTSFINTGAIELTNSLAGQAAILNVTGTLTNAAGATISSLPGLGGGTRTLGVALDNQGTVTLSHPLTLNRAAAIHANTGTLSLSAGDLTLSGATSFTNTGTITVPAGRLWTINNGTFNHQGILDGGGALTMNSVTSATFGAAFTLSGLTLNNTTASFANNLTTAGLALVLNNATLSGPGTLTNAAGETLTLTNSTDIGASMPVANLGTLIVRGSNSINTLTTTAASLLRVEGSSASTGTLTVGTSFINNGTIELTNSLAGQAAILNVTGTLTNSGGATISSLPGLGGGTRTLGVALDNQGTVTLSHPLTLNRAAAIHANTGTLSLSAGDLTLSGATSFTNSGTITVPAGRLWTINNGTFNHQGILDGGGALTMNSVTNATFGAAFALSGLTLNNTTASFANNLTTAGLALALNNATLSGPGTLTNAAGQTLTLTNSTTIAASMPVTNEGTLVIHSSNTINTLNTAGTSVVRIEGSSASTGTLTVSTSFTNNGAVELTNTLAGQAAVLAVPAGMTNAAGGTVASLAGLGGGTRTITGQLSNQGSVTVGGVGAAGTLTVSGAFTQGPAGVLNMELGGTVAGTQYDQIIVNGTPATVTLAGTLNVSLINAFVPSATIFNVMTYGSNPLGGGFSPANLPLSCSAGPIGTNYRVSCP